MYIYFICTYCILFYIYIYRLFLLHIVLFKCVNVIFAYIYILLLLTIVGTSCNYIHKVPDNIYTLFIYIVYHSQIKVQILEKIIILNCVQMYNIVVFSFDLFSIVNVLIHLLRIYMYIIIWTLLHILFTACDFVTIYMYVYYI